MISSFTRYHLLPLGMAILLTLAGIFVYGKIIEGREYKDPRHITIRGVQEKLKGHHANLLAGDQAEINFIGSIKNPYQLTVFGSSELADVPYASYNFLPDSAGKSCFALGHAYHQELAIFCELLAAYEYVEGSQVCIILSPTWFNTGGTNIQAFIEFVRPNFLDKIANDSTIPLKYKSHIGEYISRNLDLIESPSYSMLQLRRDYLKEQSFFVRQAQLAIEETLLPLPTRKTITYEVDTLSNTFQNKHWQGNFDSRREFAKTKFLETVTTNEMFVYDKYFTLYLMNEDGSPRSGSFSTIDLDGNQEFEDFIMLLDLLKSKNVNASFVMQPMNPYYYKSLEKNQEAIDKIGALAEAAGFPFLNMYVSTKEEYQPGSLKDVMHLGDCGWLTINEFLLKTYYE